MSQITPNILENDILRRWPEVLQTLLIDHTTHRNIIWATDMYVKTYGIDYAFDKEIKKEQITGKWGEVIKPRALKSKEEQVFRIKDKAEVFTPSWVCNAQNNLIDDAWFDRKNVFNREYVTEDGTHTWEPINEKIIFPENKTWKDYVRSKRLEITCGEAPYLVSRYDTTTGEVIPLECRIGILDRKLRIVSENTDSSDEWLDWAQESYKNTYGYEWQGDNLLLARENLLYTFLDYYEAKFSVEPLKESIIQNANIISWNLWQMDGLKFVVPNSCHDEISTDLFGNETKTPCLGCKIGYRRESYFKHNGIYTNIMDWDEGHPIHFSSLLKKTTK